MSDDSGIHRFRRSGCVSALPVHEERAAETEQFDQRRNGGQTLGDGDAEPSGVVPVVQFTTRDGGEDFVGDLARGFDLGGFLCRVVLQLVLLQVEHVVQRGCNSCPSCRPP